MPSFFKKNGFGKVKCISRYFLELRGRTDRGGRYLAGIVWGGVGMSSPSLCKTHKSFIVFIVTHYCVALEFHPSLQDTPFLFFRSSALRSTGQFLVAQYYISMNNEELLKLQSDPWAYSAPFWAPQDSVDLLITALEAEIVLERQQLLDRHGGQVAQKILSRHNTIIPFSRAHQILATPEYALLRCVSYPQSYKEEFQKHYTDASVRYRRKEENSTFESRHKNATEWEQEEYKTDPGMYTYVKREWDRYMVGSRSKTNDLQVIMNDPDEFQEQLNNNYPDWVTALGNMGWSEGDIPSDITGLPDKFVAIYDKVTTRKALQRKALAFNDTSYRGLERQRIILEEEQLQRQQRQKQQQSTDLSIKKNIPAWLSDGVLRALEERLMQTPQGDPHLHVPSSLQQAVEKEVKDLEAVKTPRKRP